VVPRLLRDTLEEEDIDLLEYCEEVRCLMSSLATGRLAFDEFLSLKHKLDVHHGIHEEAVVDLVQDVRREIKYLEVFPA
jgi:hypothetical protein